MLTKFKKFQVHLEKSLQCMKIFKKLLLFPKKLIITVVLIGGNYCMAIVWYIPIGLTLLFLIIYNFLLKKVELKKLIIFRLLYV